MSDSILTSTKKSMGIAEDYEAFDPDLIMHINSTFSTLNSIGVGPEHGFMITDKSATWTELLEEDNRLNSVKSYVYLKVRLIFDPPASSAAAASFDRMATEFEWRLNIQRESTQWTRPSRPEDVREDLEYEIDGGGSSD